MRALQQNKDITEEIYRFCVTIKDNLICINRYKYIYIYTYDRWKWCGKNAELNEFLYFSIILLRRKRASDVIVSTDYSRYV